MRMPRAPLGMTALTVLALVVILAVLAFLQYRWIGEVSRADRERRQIALETAVSQFREDFYTELVHVCLELRPGPTFVAARDWSQFAVRYEDFERTSTHPELVADIFIWEAEYQGRPRLLKFVRAKGQFEPAEWPAEMRGLEARFLTRMRQPREPQPDGRLFVWTLDERFPALMHPLVQLTAQQKTEEPRPQLAGFIFIRLSADCLQKEIFPQLVSRHFGRPSRQEYRVEIVDPEAPSPLIYRSDPALPLLTAAEADAAVNLIGEPMQDFLRLSVVTSTSGGEKTSAPAASPGPPPTPLVVPERDSGGWRLLVKHRYGSLADVAAMLRRRDLALSFGVLLLLAISMGMIVVFTQRVQRLAKLQMDFVAGVSHELRTPLAVICSAAENLADGVVDPKPPVKEYGALIRDEGRRLSGMVEQILRFSAAGPARHYELKPVEPAGALDAALKGIASVIEAGGVQVEKTIEANLVPVLADEAALRQCLENLLVNAVKYGGDSRWVGVRARVAELSSGKELQITVEDRGVGIEPEDLPYIFQPFYRGKAARSAQVHGTGLGLSLVKDFAQAMGGRISVRSTPGHGSAFTLHLPAASTETHG